jgi:hypothetical protein
VGRWRVAHRTAAVRFYCEARSVIRTKRHWRQQFDVPERGAIPSRSRILLWIRKFENTGSVSDSPHGGSRTVRTEENVRRAMESFQRSPTCLDLQHSRTLGISRRRLGRILQGNKNCSIHMVPSLFHKVISRFGDVQCPARSPDVTVPDYFLCGYLKEWVYRTRPHTTQDLKRALQDEIALINQDQHL